MGMASLGSRWERQEMERSRENLFQQIFWAPKVCLPNSFGEIKSDQNFAHQHLWKKQETEMSTTN